MIPYPDIDPVIIQIGPFAIRWYALAYIAGLLLGWQYMKRLAALPPWKVSAQDVDDFLVWATLGVVLGGRLGYVLFYKPAYYLSHPLEIPQMWQGGMSFHGGAIGVILAIILFAHRRGLRLLQFGDIVVCTVPIGLFFGRIANFINGELFGRVTDSPLGMVFPHGGPLPRHPSQLYEALLEGLVLFLVLFALSRSRDIREKPGFLSGAFLAGYAIARIIAEFFREPDAFLGFLFAGATMGQLLSLPMLLAGLALMLRARRVATAR